MVLCVVVYVGQVILARTDPSSGVLDALTLRPGHLDEWWTLATYAFLHGSLMHLAGNMLFLWVFGPNVEDRLGRVWYLLFYIAGGACAGLIHSAFSEAPVIGASGAIAAVTGAYLVLFPRTVIRTLVLLFVIGVFSIPAVWFIGFQIAWNVFTTGTGSAGNVATMAHLGGYAFGITVSLIALWTGLLDREVYDLFTITRQAKRRRGLRGAQQQLEQRPLAPVEKPMSEALLNDRAEVVRLVNDDEMPLALSAYKRLAERYAEKQRDTLFSRRCLYDLANHAFQVGDHQTAADLYERLLAGYPRDPEIADIKLMLGTINARYLNDPVHARRLITEAMALLHDDDKLAMARRELEALG